MEKMNLIEAVNKISECAKENGINISKQGVYYLVAVFSQLVIGKRTIYSDYKERLQGLPILMQLAMNKNIKIGTIEVSKQLYNRIKEAIQHELLHGQQNDLAFLVEYERQGKFGEFPSFLPKIDWNNREEIKKVMELFPKEVFKAEEDLDSESNYSTKIDIPKLVWHLTWPYYLQENQNEDTAKTLPKQWVIFIYDLLVLYDLKEEVERNNSKYDRIKTLCKKDSSISKESAKKAIESGYEMVNERIIAYERLVNRIEGRKQGEKQGDS